MNRRPEGPLDKYRRIQQSANSDDPRGVDAGHLYKAYDIGGQSQERLQIRRFTGPTHSPSYRYLMDIMYNGDQGTQIILVYSFLMVKIRGKNLLELVHSLEQGSCIYIQEFHQNEYSRPQPIESIIEDIDIVVRQGDDIGFDKDKNKDGQ